MRILGDRIGLQSHSSHSPRSFVMLGIATSQSGLKCRHLLYIDREKRAVERSKPNNGVRRQRQTSLPLMTKFEGDA